MEAVLLVFGLVFVAELGDKSQLIVLSFALRHRMRDVVAGFVLAAVATQTLSVTAGGLLGAVLEGPVMSLLAALIFLGFAVLLIRGAPEEEAEGGEPPARAVGRSAVLAVAGSVFLGEVGDKTMLVTMALAAREGVVAAWAGSVAAMLCAGLLGAGVGRSVRGRIPDRALTVGAGVLFAVFGALLLVDAVRAW